MAALRFDVCIFRDLSDLRVLVISIIIMKTVFSVMAHQMLCCDSFFIFGLFSPSSRGV